MAAAKKTKDEVPANLKVVLKVGNLPEAIAQTAITYEDSAKFDAVAPDGSRFSHCRYKITAAVKAEAAKVAPADYEHPANFAVVVPIINPVAEDFPVSAEDWAKFCAALVEDHQDSIIKACADAEVKISPVDLAVLVADYFDRSRGDSTRKINLTWCDDVFRKAYVERIVTRNELAKDPASGLAVVSMENMTRNIKLFRGLVDQISGQDDKAELVDKRDVNSLRQAVESVILNGHMVADDVSAWIIARCVKIASVPERTIEV
jgi:hypothetical protein